MNAALPQPSPGDFVVGCVHRPNPDGSHVIYIAPGLPIALVKQDARARGGHRHFLVGGIEAGARAHWLFVCDACFDFYAIRSEIPIGCASVWPEGARPLVYRVLS